MSSLRIIAGAYRRRRLELPRGVSIRPTSSRLKESIFATLHFVLPGARFLDLCAGTGAIGLEAASRGAAEVVLVERDRRCVAAIRRNAANCGAEHRVEVVQADCLAALEQLWEAGRAFDILFADPPYDSDLLDGTVEALRRRPELVGEGGWVCLEHEPRHPDVAAPLGFEVQSRKHFGDQAATFLRRIAAGVDGPGGP